MGTAPPTTPAAGPRRSPTNGSWLFALAVFVAGGLLFAGLSAYLKAIEQGIVSGAALAEQLGPGNAARPVANVQSAVRAMKLVTVQIDTIVTATAADESWRGDVSATLRAPVRLYYGTDLSRLSDGAVSYSPVLDEYLVRVPRPVRIATEVYPDAGDPEVQVGWLRFRSRAGEYYLGQARRGVTDRAREMVLSPDDARRVEEATREQIAGLVRAITGREEGQGPRVRVVFEAARAGGAASAAGAEP